MVLLDTWSLNFDEDEVGGVVVEVTGRSARVGLQKQRGGPLCSAFPVSKSSLSEFMLTHIIILT